MRSGNEPKFPNFTELRQRLKTFDRWQFSQIQSPQLLADAGFFYPGEKIGQ